MLNGRVIFLYGEPTGSILTVEVDVFAHSVFCTDPAASDPSGASKYWEKKAEDAMKTDNCKHRHDIARPSIDIEWHVCPRDTSVQILKAFMSGTRHAPENFPDRITFASVFTDITLWNAQQVQALMSSSSERSSYSCINTILPLW